QLRSGLRPQPGTEGLTVCQAVRVGPSSENGVNAVPKDTVIGERPVEDRLPCSHDAQPQALCVLRSTELLKTVLERLLNLTPHEPPCLFAIFAATYCGKLRASA